MDALIWLRKSLSPHLDRFRLRRLARNVYRSLLRLRYGADGLATTRQNGRTWKLHYEVALRGELQEFDTIRWLQKVVKPGDCVIDVGANVGQMTLEAAHLVGSGGKVVAIEPAPGNLKLMRAHVAANGFSDRVEIIEAACAFDNEGDVVLHIYGDRTDCVGSGHTTREHPIATEKSVSNIRVPKVSIDGLCADHNLTPRVIKIDVEGAEIEVVRGAISTLRTFRPRVRIGFHPFAFADASEATWELRELLAGCGYETPEPVVGGSYELREYEATYSPDTAIRIVAQN
ncbi:MAG: FkbM family methyltransferase [Pirellulales bacterium]